MKTLLFILSVAASGCSLPDFESRDMEDPLPPMADAGASFGTMVRENVQVTRQSLNGVSVRISFITNWDRDWDSTIKYLSPEDGPAGGYSPAPQYESTTFNLYVAEEFPGGVFGPAVFSNFSAPTSFTFLPGRPTVCGHKAGFSRMQYDYPWMSNLIPGHAYRLWLMPRCSSGSWPVGGPAENQWSWILDLPVNPGNYTFYPARPGFYGAKAWWRSWFAGCGNAMAPAWSQTTTLQMWACYRPNSASCVCGQAVGPPVTTTWQ